MSQTSSRFKDLKYVFLEPQVAEALAANGLYKKLQFLFDLGQKLIKGFVFPTCSFIYWP